MARATTTKEPHRHVYSPNPKYTAMLRILVPVSFEDSTNNACQYALRLASAAPQAEILLLHCFNDYLAPAWDPMPYNTPGVIPPPSEVITEQVLQRNEEEERNKLEALRLELQKQLSGDQIQLQTAFVSGNPEDAILEEAKRVRADLLVMGTLGEDSLSRSLFGTVTTKMAEDAKVPVLAVPVKARQHSFSRVLFATDFNSADAQAIADLQKLLAPFHPNILCLHVCEGSMKAADQEKMDRLKAATAQTGISSNVRFTLLESDDVADALEDFVAEEQVSLLAVTNHKRSFLDSLLHSSLTKKLVLETEVPILVFHG